jgi:hypothetical protein
MAQAKSSPTRSAQIAGETQRKRCQGEPDVEPVPAAGYTSWTVECLIGGPRWQSVAPDTCAGQRQNEVVTGPAVRGQHYENQLDRSIAGGIYRFTQCESCNGLLGERHDARFGRCCHDPVQQPKPGEVILVQCDYT